MVILACVVDLKQNQADFSLHLTVWSCLQLAQNDVCILRSGNFHANDDDHHHTTTDGQTDCFIPCACMCGLNINYIPTHTLPIFLYNWRSKFNTLRRQLFTGTFFCDFDLKYVLRVLNFAICTQKWYRVDKFYCSILL